MNIFTIKEIEQLCGIKAHTLRIWEQRYKIISPKRKESKHRAFDNEDLKHILRITFLYNTGLKISKIAKLSPKELSDMAMSFIKKDGAHFVYEMYINQLISATLDFDEKAVDDIIQQAIDRKGVERTITDIIYPFFEKIGMLWLTDNAIPAQEHFSSNVIRQKLIKAIESIPVSLNKGNTFLLYTPEDEFHEMPLLFMHYLLKKAGQHVYYLGTNIPLQDLAFVVKKKNVTHLYTHLITHFAKLTTDSYIEELSQQFKDQQIIISGPITKSILNKPGNVQLLCSMKEILSFGKNQSLVLG